MVTALQQRSLTDNLGNCT